MLRDSKGLPLQKKAVEPSQKQNHISFIADQMPYELYVLKNSVFLNALNPVALQQKGSFTSFFKIVCKETCLTLRFNSNKIWLMIQV